MQHRISFATALVVGCAGFASATPDLTMIGINSISKLGEDASSGRVAYAMGVTTCNRGLTPVPWVLNSSDHPVRTQNLYRVLDGELAHLGQAWVFHAFCALSLDCNGCVATGCDTLGGGCATNNATSTSGAQANLGRKSEIHPSTGLFIFPFDLNSTGPASITKRLQVKTADLGLEGARYFAAVQGITAADAAAGTDSNNQAWREALPGVDNSLEVIGSTFEQQSPIDAWAEIASDEAIHVHKAFSDAPSGGRYEFGATARDLGDGVWRYAYAVQNVNASAGGASLVVPSDAGSVVVSHSFTDVDYHSGEAHPGTDWIFSSTADLVWQALDENVLAWDTTYSFGVTINIAPTMGMVELELDTGESVSVVLPVPQSLDPADFNGDGSVNSDDYFEFLAAFFDGNPSADFDGSGMVNSTDYFEFLSAFFGA